MGHAWISRHRVLAELLRSCVPGQCPESVWRHPLGAKSKLGLSRYCVQLVQHRHEVSGIVIEQSSFRDFQRGYGKLYLLCHLVISRVKEFLSFDQPFL